MQRYAEPVKRGFQWLKCSKCQRVVRHYDAWPILHDMDGGVWALHFKSLNELLKPEYQANIFSCEAVA